MGDLFDLNQVRTAREQPDPEHVQRDQFGRPMFRFALAYELNGKAWAPTSGLIHSRTQSGVLLRCGYR
ncbi:MAG: hypothetical protein WBB98_15360 [Xanthobacteraceae bacterium]